MRVMSYAMFGRFYETVPVILRAHHSVYPGWQIRIHHDTAATDSGYWQTLLRLDKQGLVKLVHVDDEPRYTRAMLWRLLPIWTDAEVCFCRDLDALPMPKERRAVEMFMSMPKYIAHGINDNPAHGIPLMGGMCGFRCEGFRQRTGLESFAELADARPRHWGDHGTDQVVIGELWPLLADRALINRMHSGATAYRDCECVCGDFAWPLPDVMPEVEAQGDRFINYIGAAGTNTPWPEMIRFYDDNANDAVRAIIAAEADTKAKPIAVA